MPIQRSFFGRPVPAMPPRRIATLLATIALFAVITLVFTLPNSIPSGPSLGKFTDHKISLPKLPKPLSPSILNPFRPAAHAPQVQPNSTNGESKWFSNWNWLSPFSSSVTLDENRSLLPPIEVRPPIYTYYDNSEKRSQDLKDAEDALLLTWRRAWWAQGFRPIILSPAEATLNPLYRELQGKELDSALKVEISRWLAWENIGTGILCSYLLLPMGAQEDDLLSFLRRGKYPILTRFENMGHGIFVGSKAEITAAVKAVLNIPDLKTVKDFISAVPKDTFEVDPHHESIAFYDPAVVKEKYPKLSEGISTDAKGLKSLNKLIISHLHSTWQSMYPNGIAVLKPNPDHMSAAIEPALKLAKFLAQCPKSPVVSSCPPNRPRCNPCVSSVPLKISTPSMYQNASGLYTIGTVLHPFTTALLTSFRENIDVPWIRRESTRDPWVTALTKQILGTGVSGAPRVIKLKEAVASEHGTFHSLWVTAEKEIPRDLDWRFGFTIPQNATSTGKSETPVPGPERRPTLKPDPKDGPVANPDDLDKERAILRRAKAFQKARTHSEEKLRGAIEAWNLADTESWKFAKAFLARSSVERQRWEEEEEKYVGGAGAERRKSKGWGRWFDD